MIRVSGRKVERIFIGTKEVEKIYSQQDFVFCKPNDELTYELIDDGMYWGVSVSGISDSTIKHISIPSQANIIVDGSQYTLGVEYISSRAFSSNRSISSVVFPNTIRAILDGYLVGNIRIGAFSHSTIESIYLNKTMTIGNFAFYMCEKLTSITFPMELRTIGYEAFYGCTSLEEITIPSGSQLESIGTGAFCVCSSLKSYYINGSVTEIGEEAFNTCTSLETLEFNKNCTANIPNGMCIACINLKTVTLSANLKSIGDNAFLECNNLTDVYYKGTQEQWNAITIGSNNTALTNATIHFNS